MHDLKYSEPVVATVPTVYGIETLKILTLCSVLFKLQQYLPFTVLKPSDSLYKLFFVDTFVATVPTVYGIET